MNKQGEREWHYTDHGALLGILQSGCIMPSDRVLAPGCPPLVWVSAARHWEPVCLASARLGFDGQLTELGPDEAGKAVRIEVMSAVEWCDYLSAHGVPSLDIFAAAQSGYTWHSNPENWYIVPGEIPVTQWLGVDVWDGGEWIRVWQQSEERMNG